MRLSRLDLRVLAALAVCAAPALTAQRTAPKQPNFVVIVADDMGFSDLGSFGGDIETPTLDDLAKRGTRYTGFYVSATCSPTRAMLLSGIDNHLAGVGNFYAYTAPNQLGVPGYEGQLNHQVAALPELLKAGGYHTYMTGKWHLGKDPDKIPGARGFERDFTLLEGGGAYYNDAGLNEDADPSQYTEDGKYLDKLPGGFYATKTYTDKMIEYIESNRGDGKPFFAYVAHQAPHDPFQTPKKSLRKYRGWYDCGWDQLRFDREVKLRDMGLMPSDASRAPRYWYVPAWDDMTPAAQTTMARKMELYASMVESMDEQIGRLVAYLRETGELENTYIIVLSDNGPETSDAISAAQNSPAYSLEANWLARTYDIDFASWGRPGSFISYGASWAQVSATPFFGSKGSLYEGGIRAPLIVVAPDGRGAGSINTQAMLHATDLAPTILDIAGIPQATTFDGHPVLPMQGKSWRGMIEGRAASPRGDDEWIAFELFGQRAVREGPWKLLWQYQPFGTEGWQLFNLDRDLAEQHDVAAEQPEVLARMLAHWNAYVTTNNVILPNRNPFEQMAKRLPARPEVLDDHWPRGAEPNYGEVKADEDAPLACYVRK